MDLPLSVKNEIQTLLTQNRKIEAVKLVYETMHCGLMEAKEYIDHWSDVQQITTSSNTMNNSIDNEILSLIRSGNKLMAVKVYREYSGKGLAESKDYVDYLSEHGASSSFEESSQIDRIVKQQSDSVPGKNNSFRTTITLIVLLVIALLIYSLTRK